MINREFLKAGHLPTLLSAFFYFDMSFMVWVLLGALAVQISADLALNPAQKGFMVALPVLAGALLRVVLGIHASTACAKGCSPCSPPTTHWALPEPPMR